MSTERQSIEVEFFASLKESVGHRLLTIPASEARNLKRVGDVRAWVLTRLGESRCSELMAERTRTAVNDEFAGLDDPVCGGDRVAFMPAVTGG